jgi:hypothetical protein
MRIVSASVKWLAGQSATSKFGHDAKRIPSVQWLEIIRTPLIEVDKRQKVKAEFYFHQRCTKEH